MIERTWARFGPWLRWVLPALGLGFVVYFVRRTGPRQVLEALLAAGRYAPLLILLEVLTIATDVKAFASLLGPAAVLVPWRSWLRSAAAAYTCYALLPAGRTASEVARASLLAPDVGAVRAATAGAQLQAAALLADGLSSGACALVLVVLGGELHQLPAMLGGNFALTAGGGVGLLLLLRHRRVAVKIAARFPRFFGAMVTSDLHPPTLGLGACAWSLVSRALQWVQYGIAVLAMGGGFGLRGMVVAFGVHAVAATVGVGLPGQVGVADGAYLLFADTLGFRGAPAHALAVMLAIRVTQVALALVCLLVSLVVRRVPAGADI